MRRWLKKAHGSQILTEPIVLADLLHPETFLSAFRQRSARSLKCGIDDLKLISSFQPGSIKGENIIAIKDLLLQGGSMEGGKIIDQSENKVELQILPDCYLTWMPKKESGVYSDKSTTDIPVYFTLSRETLLCQFTLPQVGNADDKVISGMAIFLQGSE